MMLANRPYHQSRLLAAGMAASCLFALSACASKQALNAQLTASREAVELARTAGAPNIAPTDYNIAHEKLGRANTAARTQDYVVAMRLAEEAQADAELAQAKTGSAHVTTTVVELVKSNQALREEINRAAQRAAQPVGVRP